MSISCFDVKEGVSPLAHWTSTEFTMQHWQPARIATDVRYLQRAFAFYGAVRVVEVLLSFYSTFPLEFCKARELLNALDPFTIYWQAHNLRQPVEVIVDVDPLDLNKGLFGVCKNNELSYPLSNGRRSQIKGGAMSIQHSYKKEPMGLRKMEDPVLKHIVNNIFLPIELPQVQDESGADAGMFVRLVENALALLELEELKETKAMMKSWGMAQQKFLDWETVLKNIEPGKTCALYLPMQNAGLTVSIPANDSALATLVVFRVAARSSEVMGAPGVLSGTFPGWSVTTESDRVRNASFAKQVAELANHAFEEMYPKSKKAGTFHAEHRDVVDARYVTEWLLGAVAGNALITGVAGVKRVRKKIRDEILWKHGSLLPWRRSGEYSAVKVVLHSTLMGGGLGESGGLLAYKLIMLKLMSTCLQRFAELDTDVILQMLSKVARRISKIEELSKQRVAINDSLHRCVQRNVKEICELVISVRVKLDEVWQNIRKQEAEDSDINVDKSKLNFEGDLRHSFQTAWPHLQVALSPTSLHFVKDNFSPPLFSRNQSRDWPDVDILCNAGSSDELIRLHDIEVWVRDVLFAEHQGDIDRPDTQLFKLLVKYIDRAKRFYNGDCLGSSRMILTATTIVSALDMLAGREFPLLHQYDAGVDVSVLQYLLLPHRHDMEHLTKLEAYFARRLEKSTMPYSLISEDVPSPQSFAVCQAQRDPEVAKRRTQILEFARQEKLKKREELSKARKIHKNLLDRAKVSSCEFLTDFRGYTNHSWYCQKCSLEKQASAMLVNVFEFPLPKQMHLQDAVVGELVAPTSSWTTLRDALHVFRREVLGVKLQACKKEGTWRTFEPLKRWVRTPSESPLITLGSTTKLIMNSHYSSWHPDTAEEHFFPANGFNVHLVEHDSDKLASKSTCKETPDVRLLTTLSTDGAYSCLQWTMGTSHTENEVLCKQSNCPPDLNLAEFKAFGTLRAGQRLQMRNLVRVLEMQALSLSQPSVVNLISQALWQTGPPNGVWFRDSQLDLRDEAFARYTLQRLRFLTRNVGDNWKDHLTLLSIVTVGARVLSFSEPSWEMAAMDVLQSCRDIAERWLTQIEGVLRGMMASPVREVQIMRLKLVEVAGIAALTFDVDVGHLESLAMTSNEDAIYWLRALARIHDNVLLNSESAMSMFQRNLLRRVQLTALHLEKPMQRYLEDCLNGFVSRHWADATQGHIEECWTCYEWPRGHWWTTTFKHSSLEGHKSTLHVDTLQGSFLVNGLPVGRLPRAITSHKDYARVFGCHVFEVQPAAASGGSFVSVQKFGDSVFTFALQGKRLLVKDRRHDKHEYELFPNRFFGRDLPSLLIENFSHWILMPKTKSGSSQPDVRILCRPVKFDDDHFADDVVPFEINGRSVQDTQRDRKLVDICSTSFKEVYDGVLHRLELPAYVHVFVSNSSSEVHAELPRMGLSFHIKEGVLLSREQPGFKVSENQSLGTLIGLRHGVLLTELNVPGRYITPKRSLIMPHTMALSRKMENRPKCGQRHPVVGVKNVEFSSPSFFIYDVDHRLQCLRAPASQAAWLYLALLHALTAHPLPDPFTGLTGAESAIRILQSPRCWSCKPYDSTSVSILQNIEKLAPRREWYPEHLQCMQSVSWPEGLFPSTALDAFRIIVEKLVKGSKQLSVLFPSSGKAPLSLPTECAKLRLKSYWRARSFLGLEARMTSSYEGEPPALHFTTMNLSEAEGNILKELKAMRALAEIGFQWRSARFEPWPKLDVFGDKLISTLMNFNSLRGATRNKYLTIPSTVTEWRELAVGQNFVDNWINLYNLARNVSVSDRQQEFTFLLSLLSFCGVDYQLLFPLLCVAIHAKDFKDIIPPEHECYEFTNQTDFNLTSVRAEIEVHAVPFNDWKRSDDAQMPTLYRQSLAQDVTLLAGIAQRSWSCWPNTAISYFSASTVAGNKARDGVSKLFTRWHHNQELQSFLSHVMAKIGSLSYGCNLSLKAGPLELLPVDITASSIPYSCKLPIASLSFESSQKYSEAEAIFQAGEFGNNINLKCKQEKHNAVLHDPHPLFLEADPSSSACQVSEVFKADLRSSWDERYKLQAPPLVGLNRMHLVERFQQCERKSSSLWKDINDVLMPREEDSVSGALEAAGLWRRVTLVVLLPLLVIPPYEAQWGSVRIALGALAVIWTLEQQAERCLRFFDTNVVAFQKELDNTGPRNWKPIDRPEWLLLELEGDYRMRKVQVDVTNAMLKPKDGQNAVLQLNMGEGKTSVIVPALCASISDGRQFARLTVLSSLFRINFDALAFKLGGLLNRRVYTFPCCRDMKLSAGEVTIMKSAYQECIVERGIVVTRPEHRLSAQLMSLELCRAGSGNFRDLLDLVNSRASDVLDESDLILQVKYQVVYTIGEQKDIGGGNYCWKLSQSVLRSARRHFGSLSDQFGPDAIEFKEAEEGPSSFPHVRLLKKDLNVSLCERIVDDILDGRDEDLAMRELQQDQKKFIRAFVLDSTVSLEGIQGILPREGPLLHIVLILRGLLCYGVFMHAIRLRWRVEFGVRPSGRPLMAVPFRAKDVPAERAEYGHPDVAIMLTQLSYYNSGLSDEQLLDAFQRLNRLSSRDHEYKRWLKDTRADLPATLSDVNLDDFVQRKQKLFPMLRRNMRVIDFWLSMAVFPVECKQFEEKLVASAWDLCSGQRPVCGFSGTKDTRLLLPISISQRGLPELQGTDGVVIANLLREENRTYRSLPPHVAGPGILKEVIDHEARVLLDVGALMVDLRNREVATTWLKMMPGKQGIAAAIYFDDRDNQIMAVDRDGHDAPLPLSPYHRKMDACVVYLDDVHTRGTDLKLPVGYHACVTLGRGITKDCLVQACMRMRMLGGGHSVSFWASHEVHTSILLASPHRDPEKLTSEDVLDWVIGNSVRAIKDGFRHWGAQGITHCRRQTVNRLASKGTISLQTFGELNTQKEVIDLVECYGNERRAMILPEIISKWVRNAAANMRDATHDLTSANTAEIITELGHPIVERVMQYVPKAKFFAQVLDEEQERELEHELEEEEEIQRPGAAKPHIPHVSPDVRNLASGKFNPLSQDFLPALKALQCCSSLWKQAEPEAWSSKIYVTRDFATVVSTDSPVTGIDFLRPVAWAVVLPCIKPEAIVFLSSFEANELISNFRKRKGARLHMFAPRLRAGQDLMLLEHALVLPVAKSTRDVINRLPIVSQLLAFSGSAFFASESEQSAYCDFLGLCPGPRSEAKQNAFDRGDIGFDGFVLPGKRGAISSSLKAACGFERSPVGFMAELLSARGWHGYPSSSHVGQILHMGRCASDLSDEESEEESEEEEEEEEYVKSNESALIGLSSLELNARRVT